MSIDPAVAPAAGAAGGGSEHSGRRPGLLAVWVFVAWTLFVWVGRVRNALADPDLDGSERVGPLVLSSVFVLGALVVLAFAVRAHRAAGTPGDAAASGALRIAVWVLGGVTTAVWVVRAGDIALAGDHEVGFVIVHVVLAVVSIGLAAWAGVIAGRRYVHILPVRA